jgi:hypothetical protein
VKASDTHYQDRVVYIGDLVKDEHPPIIEGFSFDGCHILGPAVLMLIGDKGSLMNCTFDADNPDGVFWQIAPEQEYFIGCIGIKDCHFSRCTFKGIGIIDKGGALRAKVAA